VKNSRRDGEEDRKIKQLLSTLELAWNNEDLNAYAALYAAKATYVSRNGSLWFGRKQIERQHRLAFRKGLRGSQLRLRGVRIQLLSARIAVVHAEVKLSSRASHEKATKARTTLVLQFKRSAGWRIAAAHSSELIVSAMKKRKTVPIRRTNR